MRHRDARRGSQGARGLWGGIGMVLSRVLVMPVTLSASAEISTRMRSPFIPRAWNRVAILARPRNLTPKYRLAVLSLAFSIPRPVPRRTAGYCRNGQGIPHAACKHCAGGAYASKCVKVGRCSRLAANISFTIWRISRKDNTLAVNGSCAIAW